MLLKRTPIFGFYMLLFIGKSFCLQNSRHKKFEEPTNKKNPWEEYMKLFDIPKNHNSGISVDLGETVRHTINGTAFNFSFPNGKCPVFGKIIKITNNYNFSVDAAVVNATETELLLLLLNGGISTFLEDVKGINFPAETLSKVWPQFKELKSPSQQNSIYECSSYANKFEHIANTNQNLDNCVSIKNKTCIKHPFIYNLNTKECFVLFPLLQHGSSVNLSGKIFYFPTKEIHNSHFVFGSSSIKQNWPESCPVKPIKGALFGLWQNGRCTYPIDNFFFHNITFSECSNRVFSMSRRDIQQVRNYNLHTMEVNWANWKEGECEIISRVPDCLYHSKEGFALTSVGIHSQDIYDLPPCIIGASDEWTVRGSSNDTSDKLFTCHNGKWVTDINRQITKHEIKQTSSNSTKINNINTNNINTNNINTNNINTNYINTNNINTNNINTNNINTNNNMDNTNITKKTKDTESATIDAESGQIRAFANTAIVLTLVVLFF